MKRGDSKRMRWCARLAVLIAGALVVFGFGAASGSTVAHAQIPEFDICDYIPPELWPFVPECQDQDDPGEPGGEVDDFFSATGPWTVSTGSAAVPAADGVQFWYPTDLGADGVEHTVLTWGNGSDTETSSYTELLEHLASWGFVVVASDSGQTGSGDEILAAAEWMVDQNSEPDSIFFENLDTTNVGSVGHSQGADGALFSAAQSNGLITSTLPIALPDRGYGGDQLPVASMDNIPIFYMYGADDFITAIDQEANFDQSSGPALTAARVGNDHFLPFNTGEEACYFGFCFTGQASDALSYTTAWFKYTLEDDEFARSGFVGDAGEIMNNSDWVRKDQKDLP